MNPLKKTVMQRDKIKEELETQRKRETYTHTDRLTDKTIVKEETERKGKDKEK
jgi:hypothetical protein